MVLVPGNSSWLSNLTAGGLHVSSFVISFVCLVLAIVAALLVLLSNGSDYWLLAVCFVVVPAVNLVALTTKNPVLHYAVRLHPRVAAIQ